MVNAREGKGRGTRLVEVSCARLLLFAGIRYTGKSTEGVWDDGDNYGVFGAVDGMRDTQGWHSFLSKNSKAEYVMMYTQLIAWMMLLTRTRGQKTLPLSVLLYGYLSFTEETLSVASSV